MVISWILGYIGLSYAGGFLYAGYKGKELSRKDKETMVWFAAFAPITAPFGAIYKIGEWLGKVKIEGKNENEGLYEKPGKGNR